MAADHIEHVLQGIELVTLALKNIQALCPLSHEPKFEINGKKKGKRRKRREWKERKEQREGRRREVQVGGRQGGGKTHLLKERMKSVHQYSV